MTDISLGASVKCAGRTCGRTTHMIINPSTLRVTHFVVREKGIHHTEHLVPVDQVMQTTRELINLRCTRDELAALELFIETQYLQMERSHYERGCDLGGHYIVPEITEWVPVRHERIPPGGLAVRRGAQVQAIDGRVGRVEEFLMDPTSGRITHLVMREGHSWAPKDVTIPISEISRIGERAVHLTLDRHSVGSLPAVPVKWH